MTDALQQICGAKVWFMFINLEYREVWYIAKNTTPINIIVYLPKTEDGKKELKERVASVHADMVKQHLDQLSCPMEQKLRLLEQIIEARKV